MGITRIPELRLVKPCAWFCSHDMGNRPKLGPAECAERLSNSCGHTRTPGGGGCIDTPRGAIQSSPRRRGRLQKLPAGMKYPPTNSNSESSAPVEAAGLTPPWRGSIQSSPPGEAAAFCIFWQGAYACSPLTSIGRCREDIPITSISLC